jgi:hypothetical protein
MVKPFKRNHEEQKRRMELWKAQGNELNGALPGRQPGWAPIMNSVRGSSGSRGGRFFRRRWPADNKW